MFYSRKVSRSGLVLFRSGAAGARKDRSVASRTSDKRGLRGLIGSSNHCCDLWGNMWSHSWVMWATAAG
jgi:hypothetical protein